MKLPQWLPAALVVMTWLMICEPALVLSRIIIVTALLSAQEQPCARPTALGHCATLQSSQNGTIDSASCRASSVTWNSVL